MATDNTVLNPGVGGDVIATEARSDGVKIAVSKLRTGKLDMDNGPVTDSSPLPVHDKELCDIMRDVATKLDILIAIFNN